MGEELIVAVQVESAAAVERIPDIAAVPGIDMIFIGPRDLSGSIGKLDQFEDPEVNGAGAPGGGAHPEIRQVARLGLLSQHAGQGAVRAR
ncbi:MAG: hypothetical protein HC871_14225, partial [Rhizobiales bacterium]|nr:hypothetical protein [Hyphomicrobiales bacterium]